MTKICIIFLGAIRNSFEDIIETIIETKNNFNFAKITTIFCTWEPTNNIYMSCGINYYYNYDKLGVTEKLKNYVDHILIMKNLEFNNIKKLKNGQMPLYIYQLKYIQNFIIENNKNFDYIIKTRNDVQFSIKDSKQILNNNIYTFPIYWQLHRKYTLLNDHIFIMSFDNFCKINMSDENIINITGKSWDCEEFNLNIISPNTLIPDDLIIFYKTFGGCKISFISQLNKIGNFIM